MTHQEAFDEINRIQDEYIDQLISLMNNKDYEMMQKLNFTSPTGTGKTNMMAKLINRFPDYYFIITTLSKGQLHLQIRDNLKKLVHQNNFYVYGSADYKINSKLDAEDIISKIPTNTKCIWLRDEGHIRTNRWDGLLEKVCYKVINFSATNTSSDIKCNFTSTMMLRTVNQTNGTPEDAINKLLEIKTIHKNIPNYNPCAIFRCVSGDQKLYQMIVDLCNKHHLKYIDITEDEYIMRQLCEDDNENDVIINKFKIVEGIDIRRAHVLYMDNQPGNNATTIQVIGRCRRNALLYRDDIDILDPKNKNILEATRECYVYYNVEKMRVDEDENGELQYAFCNHISCQELKPNTTIIVNKGQLDNGLYIIELKNRTGIFSIDTDPLTSFNVVKPITEFYSTKVTKYTDILYVEDYPHYYKKLKKSDLTNLSSTSKYQFNWATGQYDIITCDPYYNLYSFTKLCLSTIQVPKKSLDYFIKRKNEFLSNIKLKLIENVKPMKIDTDCLCNLDFGVHNSIISIIQNSKLDDDIKNVWFTMLYKIYNDSSHWYCFADSRSHTEWEYKFTARTAENDIKVEYIINSIYDFINSNNKLQNRTKKSYIKKYLTILYEIHKDSLFGYFSHSIPSMLDIMTRLPTLNRAEFVVNADYKKECYTNNNYFDSSLAVTIDDIDLFFGNYYDGGLLMNKYCSKLNQESILSIIKQKLDEIELNLKNSLCMLKIDFSNICERLTDDEAFLCRNGYYKSYCGHVPVDTIHSYKPYEKTINDLESSIIGVDLMRQLKDDEGNVFWSESKSVSSKIGNYNKFNTFISNKYEYELSFAKAYYCKGKNTFSLNKKCNSVIGYCVEYYSKYLLFGESYLGQHLTKAKHESQNYYDLSDAVIIRACMLKYKEMMIRGFGIKVSKLIKTISIDTLIKQDYQTFIALVKTLGQRTANFVKDQLWPDTKPSDNIDPNLSITHIAGLADYITEDTILDVKVHGGIGENEVRQVLAYHYLSTKRSDLNIKRVIVYDATSDRHVSIDITPENWKENQPYGYKD